MFVLVLAHVPFSRAESDVAAAESASSHARTGYNPLRLGGEVSEASPLQLDELVSAIGTAMPVFDKSGDYSDDVVACCTSISSPGGGCEFARAAWGVASTKCFEYVRMLRTSTRDADHDAKDQLLMSRVTAGLADAAGLQPQLSDTCTREQSVEGLDAAVQLYKCPAEAGLMGDKSVRIQEELMEAGKREVIGHGLKEGQTGWEDQIAAFLQRKQGGVESVVEGIVRGRAERREVGCACIERQMAKVGLLANCSSNLRKMFDDALGAHKSCVVSRDCPELLPKPELVHYCRRKQLRDTCACARLAGEVTVRSRRPDLDVPRIIDEQFEDMQIARAPPRRETDQPVMRAVRASTPLQLQQPSAAAAWAAGTKHVIVWRHQPEMAGKRLWLTLEAPPPATARGPGSAGGAVNASAAAHKPITILSPHGADDGDDAAALRGSAGSLRWAVPHSLPSGRYVVRARLYAPSAGMEGGWSPKPFGIKIGVGQSPPHETRHDCTKSYDNSGAAPSFSVCGHTCCRKGPGGACGYTSAAANCWYGASVSSEQRSQAEMMLRDHMTWQPEMETQEALADERSAPFRVLPRFPLDIVAPAPDADVIVGERLTVKWRVAPHTGAPAAGLVLSAWLLPAAAPPTEAAAGEAADDSLVLSLHSAVQLGTGPSSAGAIEARVPLLPLGQTSLWCVQLFAPADPSIYSRSAAFKIHPGVDTVPVLDLTPLEEEPRGKPKPSAAAVMSVSTPEIRSWLSEHPVAWVGGALGSLLLCLALASYAVLSRALGKPGDDDEDDELDVEVNGRDSLLDDDEDDEEELLPEPRH